MAARMVGHGANARIVPLRELIDEEWRRRGVNPQIRRAIESLQQWHDWHAEAIGRGMDEAEACAWADRGGRAAPPPPPPLPPADPALHAYVVR